MSDRTPSRSDPPDYGPWWTLASDLMALAWLTILARASRPPKEDRP